VLVKPFTIRTRFYIITGDGRWQAFTLDLGNLAVSPSSRLVSVAPEASCPM